MITLSALTTRYAKSATRPDPRIASVRYTDLHSTAGIDGSALDDRCMHAGRTARETS